MAANTKDEKARSGFFAKIRRSFRDMAGELKKVVWPSKKQVINNTLIVLGFMLVSAVVIGAFDTVLVLIRQAFFKS